MPPRATASAQRVVVRWAALVVASALCVAPLRAAHVPAALLLGTMAAGIAVAVGLGPVTVPRSGFLLAQGVVGALIAARFSPPVARSVASGWFLYLVVTLAVLGVSTLIGWGLARWRVLPGATGVWGLSPGAATAMVVMADAYGADVRIVAFMQYLRVALVAALASAVAQPLVPHSTAVASAAAWFGPPDLRLAETLALVAGGAVAGHLSRIPAGSLLATFAIGAGLNAAGLLEPELPLWLLAATYAVIGWTVGLRFTRDILVYTARALPRILAAILALVAICAGMAAALARFADLDPLTAYLATSPGGADTIAIIAASSGRDDMAFVMALQMVRAVVVIFAGPRLAAFVSDRVAGSAHPGAPPGRG
jgi:membrane AbrB-like protein